MVGTIEQKLCAASNGAEFTYYQSLVIDWIMNDTVHYSVQKVADWIQNHYRSYNRRLQ